MTASECAHRIKNAKLTGSKWSGVCPSHEDRTPSLGWWDGDSKLVVKCQAGCTRAAILAALGLQEEETRLEQKPGAKKIIATYDYEDATGALLYQCLRYTPKDFRQRRPDGDGWIWNLDGVDRVLYRLPEMQSRKSVVICEGEEDVDRLRTLGIPATCGVGGKWRPEYVEQLKAAGVKTVAILRDHDEPGEKLMRETASACWGAGLRVKTPALPGVARKEDVSDWLDHGHSKDELVALMKDAPAHQRAGALDLVRDTSGWTLPAELDVDGNIVTTLDTLKPSIALMVDEMAGEIGMSTEGREWLHSVMLQKIEGMSASTSVHTEVPRPRAVVVRADAIEAEPVEWIWPGWLALGKVHIICGYPGEGKSTVTMDMAARVTTGRAFPDGSPGCTPAGVVILNAEDGLRDTVIPRLMAAEAELSMIHIIEATRGTNGGEDRPFDISKDVDVLEETIRAASARLVVMDPLSAYFGTTNTWNDGAVRQVLSKVKEIAERTKAAIVAILHPNKSQGLQAIQRVSSSIGFGAAPRIIMSVAIDPEDPDARALGQIKNNLTKVPGARGFKFVTFKCPASDGRTITTSRLVWSKEAVQVDVKAALEGTKRSLPPALQSAIELIKEFLGDGDTVKAADVEAEAKDRKISQSSLVRARSQLGLESIRMGGRQGEWVWRKTSDTGGPGAFDSFDAFDAFEDEGIKEVKDVKGVIGAMVDGIDPFDPDDPLNDLEEDAA